MFQKFLRLIHTIKYLTWIQLVYQIYYRCKAPFIFIHLYKKYAQHNIFMHTTQVTTTLAPIHKEYLGNHTFVFTGLQHTFGNQIDWNYQQNGKLWNYHLQYFSFLLDEDLPIDERRYLLHAFSKQVLVGIIRLEPYPVSLRVVNCLLFHSRYPIEDPIILEALFKQIGYLEHNLEYHILGNHLLENIYCLYIASIYLNDKNLYAKAYQLLVEQLKEQILDDGGHFECSVMYHSILLSKLLISIDIARNVHWINQSDLAALESYASKMLGWISAYSFPDGSWALMNDASEGIAPSTNKLLEAAMLLNIPFKPSILSSCGFTKIVGEQWQLLVKTGGVQPSYQPAHTHADIGTFCVWYKGKQIIVDRGISTYAINDTRLEERSTQSHNTVSIDERNQSDVWSSFRIGKRASVLKYQENNNHIKLYITPFFDKKIIHERTFTKIDEHRFSISDKIVKSSASSNHKGFIQFSKDSIVELNGSFWKTPDIIFSFSNILNTSLEQGKYATQYNSVESASRIVYQFKDTTEITVHFL